MAQSQHKRFGWVLAICVMAALAVLNGCKESSEKSSDTSDTPAVWTCSMHPEVRRDEPGRCPICGMDLVRIRSDQPKKTDGDSTSAAPMGTPSEVPGHASVMIPGELQQRIGVRIGRVEKGPLKMTVDALGIVQPAETRIARVNIKTEGWVDKLYVNFLGQKVHKGDPLLSIYSPNFVSTQQELLTAMKAEQISGGGRQSLAEAARRRLELWDVPDDEIEQLVRTGQARKDLILRSPIDGTVLERNVFEKQYVTPEKELYVIGDLNTVWVQAKVYEYEIPHVELGMPATVTIPSLPNRKFIGKVVFIQPTVEEVARTVPVRVELANKEGIFKPGMFAQISISHPMGEGLLVPASAILRTGERDIAYRVEPGSHFVPIAVKLDSITYGGRYHVLEGLKEGEQIVTSGNFLIDSESRIRMGGGGMAGMEHGGHGGAEKQPASKDHKDHAAPQAPAPDRSGRGEQEMPGMDHSKMKH